MVLGSGDSMANLIVICFFFLKKDPNLCWLISKYFDSVGATESSVPALVNVSFMNINMTHHALLAL